MLQMNKVNRGVEGPHSINQGLPPSQDYWSPGIQASWPGWASRRRAEHHQPRRSHWCEGRRRVRRARAGFEIDHSEPQARVWRSRGRPGPTAPGTPVGPQATKAGRLPSVGTPSSPAQQGTPSSPAPQRGPMVLGTPAAPHSNTGIQAERPASSVARWTPPRSASWAAWVRHEKPSARYTASGCADRDGSSEWDATATDRS